MATKSTKKFKFWHGLILGPVILFLTIFLLAFIGGARTAMDTIPAILATEDFFESIVDGEDLQLIYEGTSSSFQETTSYEDFEFAISVNDSLLNYDYIDFDSRFLVKDELEPYVVLRGAMFDTGNVYVLIEVQVVEEDDLWKIKYVTFNPEYAE